MRNGSTVSQMESCPPGTTMGENVTDSGFVKRRGVECSEGLMPFGTAVFEKSKKIRLAANGIELSTKNTKFIMKILKNKLQKNLSNFLIKNFKTRKFKSSDNSAKFLR